MIRTTDEVFSTWLATLLRHLHLPQAPAQQPVATFHFTGKPDVHVTGSRGWIDMMSEAGRLPVPYASATLLDLLALNRCSGTDEAVSVTLDRASGSVIVWSRQCQAGLDAAGGARLLQAVRSKADAVARLLGSSVPQAPGRGSASLARMLRLNPLPGARDV